MYILLTILILLIISTFTYVRLYFKKAHQFFEQYGIPYAKPHWFFGNMKDVILMKKSIWIGFKEMYEKFPSEKFAGVYNMHKPTVMIRDPDLLRMILVKDFSYFNNRGFTVSKEVEPLVYNMSSMTGDEWKNLRIKLTSTFTSGKMKMMFPLMKKCAQDIKPVLSEYSLKRQDIDIKDVCARFTTDIIGSCAFGIDTHSLKNPESDFRQMGKNTFGFRWQAVIRTFFPNMPLSYIKTFGLEFFPKKVTDYFMKAVVDMVKYREENNVTRGDFLDLLIAMKNHKEIEKLKDQKDNADLARFMAQIGEKYVKNDVEMTIETIAAQCFLFFFGGFEGGSSALSFLLFELARHPKIQDKVRAEIRSTLENNSGEFTYEMMKQMPYLEMTLAETFRKYPLGAILFRICTENYKIPDTNVVIKKGAPVVVPVMGLHNDPKYYEKPNDFYPEHFTVEAKLKRPHFTYLPFGEGPRICIAERFARMQVTVGAVYLLKDFTWEVSPKTKLPLQMLPTGAGLDVKDGIWLKCRVDTNVYRDLQI